jgi:hypothetical protein
MYPVSGDVSVTSPVESGVFTVEPTGGVSLIS